jgi:hypothetical protein
VRIESSVTSLSWIPSEAIAGMSTKMPFEAGVAHYDVPPPEAIEDLDELRRADRFRFANHLSAWIEVRDGLVVGHGQGGGGMIGSTTLRLGKRALTFEACALPDLHPKPKVSATQVTFFQTCGGRTGVPAPRRVRRAPFVQITAPLAWTSFPRHWIYDGDGKLSDKSGTIDFASWYRRAFGKHSPWGDTDSPALTSKVESALERQLSVTVMKAGAKPKIKKVKAGAVIAREGAEEQDLFLVLDGVVRAEVNGQRLAEYGPGSLHGERAILEGGRRTATITAVTPCKLAMADASIIDVSALRELSEDHRKEEQL